MIAWGVPCATACAAEPPPLGADVPQELGEMRPRLAYGWKIGEPVTYSFDITLKAEERPLKFGGRSTLTPTTDAPAQASRDEQRSATGTAFVVHPQGILVTCAHVVHGAVKIRASLGNRELAARVIGMDDEHDLAVLRVDAQDLAYVTLGDSDRVRLAQEVRVIGFPLTEILGESIKVSRGEISGIGDASGDKVLQFDATINPGSSGGPVLDNRGQVVAVASQLVAGEGISEVGIGVPSNHVAALLRRLNVPLPTTSPEAGARPAEEIVAAASPATALVRVELGVGGAGQGPPVTLSYSGFHYPTSTAGPPGFELPKHGQGRVVVDRRGEVLDDEVELQLPCLLGGAGRLGIEPLPSSGRRFTSTRPVVLQRQADDPRDEALGRFGLPGLRYRSPLFRAPPEERRQPTLLVGLEQVTCELGDTHGSLVELRKAYELKAEEGKNSGQVRLRTEGRGEFDTDLGLVVSMKVTGTLTIPFEGKQVELPLEWNYHRLSPETLAKLRAEAEERAQFSKTPRAGAARPGAAGGDSPGPQVPASSGNGGPDRTLDEVARTPSLNQFVLDAADGDASPPRVGASSRIASREGRLDEASRTPGLDQFAREAADDDSPRSRGATGSRSIGREGKLDEVPRNPSLDQFQRDE